MRNGKFIAGIMRISDFPFNPVLAIKFAQHLDYLVLGFDGCGGYGRFNGTKYINALVWYELFKLVNPFPESCTVDMFVAKVDSGSRGRKGNDWLEEMLRRLDKIRPDYVLECEADAHFAWGRGFEKDLDDFIDSGHDMLMMMAETVTIDGRTVPHFPTARHCRGYRWYEGIYYRSGFCQIQPQVMKQTSCAGFMDRKKDQRHIPQKIDLHDKPADTTEGRLGRTMIYDWWMAETRLQHYPIFTRQMERERWEYYGSDLAKRMYDINKMPYPEYLNSPVEQW